MAPVRLIDTPGYLVRLTNDSPIPRHYEDLIRDGFDFVIGRGGPDTFTKATADKELREKNIGGGSRFRPLSYEELDKNFKEVYPLGSVYMNATDPTDPAILLGFGVWQRLPSGNALFGLGRDSLDATDLKNKITSATYDNDKKELSLRLVSRPSEAEREQKRRQPKKSQPFDERRVDNYVPGMKININGLRLNNGSTAGAPKGIFTIKRVDSDKSGNADLATGKLDDLLKDADDQNIIVISYTFAGYNETSPIYFYDVAGPGADDRDNAYVTVLDTDIVGLEVEQGNKFGEVDVLQIPPHEHIANVARTHDDRTGSVGRYDAHDDWRPNWAGGDNWVEWDTGPGSTKQPASYSTANAPHGASDISDAGEGTSGKHENRQPYVAVNMWKRIQ